MANDNITTQFCDAVEILVNNAISRAGYDKTIQAVIVSCEDKERGIYKVKYQEGVWRATSTDVKTEYSKGTNVYVLIPEGRFENEKKILGVVSNQKNAAPVSVLTERDRYRKIGDNIINLKSEVGLCSYRRLGIPQESTEAPEITRLKNTQLVGTMRDILTYGASTLDFNKTSLEQYYKQATHLLIGGNFRTALNTVQNHKGNYGITILVEYQEGDEAITLDTTKMSGNAYHLDAAGGVDQYCIAPLNKKCHFKGIKNIYFWCENFPEISSPIAAEKDGKYYHYDPVTKTYGTELTPEEIIILRAEKEIIKVDGKDEERTRPNDLFLSDLYMYCAEEIPEEELNSYYLDVITPNGAIFPKTTVNSLYAQAALKYTNSIIKDDVKFYWFVKDASVVPAKETEFQKYGDQGWRCLNQNKVTYDEEDKDKIVSVDWTPIEPDKNNGYATFTVMNSDILAGSQTYKIVAVYAEHEYKYENLIFSREIPLINISIKTKDGKTQYKTDYGDIELECVVAANPDANYTEGQNILGSNPNLSYYWNIINDQGPVTPVEDNNSNTLTYNSQALITTITFECTVYKDDKYLGTAALVLANDDVNADFKTLLINNGDQNFKYTTVGASPCSQDGGGQKIKQLTYTLKDAQGNVVEDNAGIEWRVPTRNTLIKVGEVKDKEKDIIDGYKIFRSKALDFSIEDRYNIANTVNNQITLTVKCHDETQWTTVTNFWFGKEGDEGTNGTDYTINIVPCVKAGTTMPSSYPIVYMTQKPTAAQKKTYDDAVEAAQQVYYNTIEKGSHEEDEDYIIDKIEAIKEEAKDGQELYDNLIAFKGKITDGQYGARALYHLASKILYAKPYKKDATEQEMEEQDEQTKAADKTAYDALLKDIDTAIETRDAAEKAARDTFNSYYKFKWNYEPKDEGQHKIRFAVDVYKLNQYLGTYYKTTTDQQRIDITWSILKNDYVRGNNIKDASLLRLTDGFVFDADCSDFAIERETLSFANVIMVEAVITDAETDAKIILRDSMPVIFADVSEFIADTTLDTSNNSLSIQFSDDGKQANVTNLPLEVYVYDKDGKDISRTSGFTYDWKCKGEYYDLPYSKWERYTGVDFALMKEGEGESQVVIPNKRYLKASATYDGSCVTNLAYITITNSDKKKCIVMIPLHFYLNYYGHSALNGWDGHSIQVNEDGNYILSPIVGAGRKESDNTYTGLLMGNMATWKDAKDEVGLIGLNHGQRTFFLDAETGKTQIGVPGSTGQIIIDPQNTDSYIESGNYQYKKGLKIGLSQGYIIGGAGNFSFEKNGDFQLGNGQLSYKDSTKKLLIGKDVVFQWGDSSSGSLDSFKSTLSTEMSKEGGSIYNALQEYDKKVAEYLTGGGKTQIGEDCIVSPLINGGRLFIVGPQKKTETDDNKGEEKEIPIDYYSVTIDPQKLIEGNTAIFEVAKYKAGTTTKEKIISFDFEGGAEFSGTVKLSNGEVNKDGYIKLKGNNSNTYIRLYNGTDYTDANLNVGLDYTGLTFNSANSTSITNAKGLIGHIGAMDYPNAPAYKGKYLLLTSLGQAAGSGFATFQVMNNDGKPATSEDAKKGNIGNAPKNQTQLGRLVYLYAGDKYGSYAAQGEPTGLTALENATYYDTAVLKCTANVRIDRDLRVVGVTTLTSSPIIKNGGAATGSDRKMKYDIIPIADKYTNFFNNLRPVTYKYKDGTSQRDHMGFIADEVATAAKMSSISEKELALLCTFEDEDYGTVSGLRYEEFIALLVRELQMTKERLRLLEKRVDKIN